MKINLHNDPRVFKVGRKIVRKIKDMGKIFLLSNEQLSFINSNGQEYDFQKTEWGYYATSSINNRMVKEGFKTALTINKQNRVFILAVEFDKLKIFESYCNDNDLRVIHWLDEKYKLIVK